MRVTVQNEYINIHKNLTEVLLESDLKDALISLNPERKSNPGYADEVFISLGSF